MCSFYWSEQRSRSLVSIPLRKMTEVWSLFSCTMYPSKHKIAQKPATIQYVHSQWASRSFMQHIIISSKKAPRDVDHRWLNRSHVDVTVSHWIHPMSKRVMSSDGPGSQSKWFCSDHRAASCQLIHWKESGNRKGNTLDFETLQISRFWHAYVAHFQGKSLGFCPSQFIKQFSQRFWILEVKNTETWWPKRQTRRFDTDFGEKREKLFWLSRLPPGNHHWKFLKSR